MWLVHSSPGTSCEHILFNKYYLESRLESQYQYCKPIRPFYYKYMYINLRLLMCDSLVVKSIHFLIWKRGLKNRWWPTVVFEWLFVTSPPFLLPVNVGSHQFSTVIKILDFLKSQGCKLIIYIMWYMQATMGHQPSVLFKTSGWWPNTGLQISHIIYYCWEDRNIERKLIEQMNSHCWEGKFFKLSMVVKAFGSFKTWIIRYKYTFFSP